MKKPHYVIDKSNFLHYVDTVQEHIDNLRAKVSHLEKAKKKEIERFKKLERDHDYFRECTIFGETGKVNFIIPDCKVVWIKCESFHANNVHKETKNIEINADKIPSKTQRKEKDIRLIKQNDVNNENKKLKKELKKMKDLNIKIKKEMKIIKQKNIELENSLKSAEDDRKLENLFSELIRYVEIKALTSDLLEEFEISKISRNHHHGQQKMINENLFYSFSALKKN